MVNIIYYKLSYLQKNNTMTKIETVPNYSDALNKNEGTKLVYLIDILKEHCDLDTIFFAESSLKCLSNNIAVIKKK